MKTSIAALLCGSLLLGACVSPGGEIQGGRGGDDYFYRNLERHETRAVAGTLVPQGLGSDMDCDRNYSKMITSGNYTGAVIQVTGSVQCRPKPKKVN